MFDSLPKDVMEHELYDDGSDYGDIFGGDIMISGEKPYKEILVSRVK